MSELTVAKITTPSNTTPLTFTTGNTTGGFIKVETANDQILFSGTPRFTGAVNTSSNVVSFGTAFKIDANGVVFIFGTLNMLD